MRPASSDAGRCVFAVVAAPQRPLRGTRVRGRAV